MAQMTPLRRRLLDDMTVRNLSPATQQSYVYAVAKFSRFFGLPPDRLGVEEVRAYQIHLAGQGMSWSHINQVSCALRFFFGVTLGRKDAAVRIVSAKEPKKLPTVLSADEIARFLQAVPGLRNRAALTTAYSAGLRVSEGSPSGSAISTAAAWSSGSSTAKAARIATSCFRRNCWRFCGPIGACPSRPTGSFPDALATGLSASAPCRQPAVWRREKPASKRA